MAEKNLEWLQKMRVFFERVIAWWLWLLLVNGVLVFLQWIIGKIFGGVPEILQKGLLVCMAVDALLFVVGVAGWIPTHFAAKNAMEKKTSVLAALQEQFSVECYQKKGGFPDHVMHQVFPKFWSPGGRTYIRGAIRGIPFEFSNIHCTVGDSENDPITEKFRGQWMILKTGRQFPANLLVQPNFLENPGPEAPKGTEYAPLGHTDFRWVFPDGAACRGVNALPEPFSTVFFAISDEEETAGTMMTTALMEALTILGRNVHNWLYLVIQKDGTVHFLMDSKGEWFQYEFGDTPLRPEDVQRGYRQDAKALAETIQTLLTGLDL